MVIFLPDNFMQSGKKKILRVFIVSISGAKTIKVGYSILRMHPLYKRMISKTSYFLIDISEENLLKIKQENFISEKKEIYVEIGGSRISSRKIGRFVDFIV